MTICGRTLEAKVPASYETSTREAKVNTKVLTLLVAILSLAALSGCGGNPQARAQASAEDEGSGEALTLKVEGRPEAEFSGTCAVGGVESEEIGGRTPQSFTYDLDGKPLECEIASEGDVEVTLTHGNTRSVQRIGGGTLSLTYENGSISSSTSSSSASSQFNSSSGTIDGEPADATNEFGKVASEPRDVSGFDEVELIGIGNLSIRQAGSESLTMTADEGVLPRIRTEVVDDRLIIGPEPNSSIQTTRPINYELTVADLHALKLTGSGNVDAQSISTNKLATTISGSGTVEISGKAESQEISVTGSGEYRAEHLESEEAKVDVEGAGSAVINASDALEARVGGAGSVEYVGNPTVEQDVSGAGQVNER